MPYGPTWDPNRVREVKEAAEARWRGADVSQGFLYRFEETSYSVVIDADREEYGSRTDIELYAYPIVRRTPQGHTILTGGSITGNPTRWVSDHTVKQFACPTIDKAKASYIARKKKQARIYEARAKKARYLAAKAAIPPGPRPIFGTGDLEAMAPDTREWRERALNAERRVKELEQRLSDQGWELSAHREDAQRRRDAEIGRMGGGG